MSVVSKNPFDLLDDEPKPSPAPAKAPAAAAPKATPAAPRNVPGAAPRGGAARPARTNASRGGARQTNTPRVDDSNDTFEGERVAPPRRAHQGPDKHTKTPGEKSERRPRGAGRGSKAGGFGQKREYDRKSGTLPDSQKKVEAGWGPNEGSAELSAEVEGEKDAQAEEKAPQTPAEAAEETPAEPEEVQKSLDDYLAERANAAFFGKKEARQVEADKLEGSQFVREGLDEFFAGKEKKEATKTKARKEKVTIEIDGQFAQPAGRPPRSENPRGGARGGRGRGEGRGRGAPRGQARGGRANASSANANISDEKAFPALGA